MVQENEVMWTEKYRPSSLDDVVNQKDIMKMLGAMLVSPSSVPHLLFAGPPGTGKTTVALCVAQDILGQTWRNNTLELNASDERGIQMIRERVKTFSRMATGRLSGISINVIILDECDQMTSDAQTALRRIMEVSSRNSRFILIANYSGKIIEPIQSRCAIFRFLPLKKDDIAPYLQEIAHKEGVKLIDDGLNAIITFANGDLRKAINTLQAASAMKKVVDDIAVNQFLGEIDKSDIKKMINKALEGDFREARETLFSLMFNKGLSGSEIIRQIHRQILGLDVPEDVRIELIHALGVYDFRLLEGANEDIQLSAFLAQVVKLRRRV